MDEQAVMQARQQAVRRGNKHWRKGDAPRGNKSSRTIDASEWRRNMDTTHAPDFAALLPVDTAEQFPVDARKLHAVLGVGRDFSTWIRGRIGEYGFRPGEDYTTNETVLPETGEPANRGFTTRIDYLLTLDMAKEMAMVERNEMGRLARAYFIECEKRLTEGRFPVPKTLPEALRLAADQAEEIARLEARTAVLHPKAEALDVLAAGQNSATLQKAGNQVGMGRTTLIRTLKDYAILQPNGQPYRRFIDAGYFEVKPITIFKGGRQENYPQVFVTQPGLTWLAGKMRQWGFASPEASQQEMLN